MKKLDRRILKTRKAIMAAYLSLLEEKNMYAVSVSDITERADINRATFYAHYEDKQHLQDQSIKEILDDLEEAIEIDKSGERTVEVNLKMLREIFQRMFENIYGYIAQSFYQMSLANTVSQVLPPYSNRSGNGPIYVNKLCGEFYSHYANGDVIK